MFGKKKPVNIDTTNYAATAKVTVTFSPSSGKAWRATATVGKRVKKYGGMYDHYSEGYGDSRQEALEQLYTELINDWGEQLFIAIQKTQIEFSVNGWKEITDGV